MYFSTKSWYWAILSPPFDHGQWVCIWDHNASRIYNLNIIISMSVRSIRKLILLSNEASTILPNHFDILPLSSTAAANNFLLLTFFHSVVMEHWVSPIFLELGALLLFEGLLIVFFSWMMDWKTVAQEAALFLILLTMIKECVLCFCWKN